MRDSFLDFEWSVASSYEWHLLQRRPVEELLALESSEGLLGFDSCEAVELTWSRLERRGSGTGPVLLPAENSKLSQYVPMERGHSDLFRLFAEVDYRDR